MIDLNYEYLLWAIYCELDCFVCVFIFYLNCLFVFVETA